MTRLRSPTDRLPESAVARDFGRPDPGESTSQRSWFQGKTALINSGSSGIGLATARLFAAEGVVRSGRLFLLEMSGDRIHSMNPDGSDHKTIVTGCHLPDGIVADEEAGHIYWTNMGVPNLDDGSIERADLDGRSRRVIVPQGVTHTPKQIHVDKDNGKLYWCDREGMRVMRANLDGSQVETLVLGSVLN